VAAHLLQRDPAQAYGALREIKQASGEALGDLRRALTVLRDPLLGAPLGPAAGLHDLEPLTAPLRAAGVNVAISIDPVSDLPVSVQATGYRIVQEALTNVSRHAQAANASVDIRRAEDQVRIEVADDGTGAANGSAGAGNGLRGMRERVLALGGTLEATPESTGGWRVSVMLPTIAPPGVGGAMITVELVDDQSLVRAGFCALLDAETDISVVAQAADGQEGVRLAREHRPGVVLMDVRMPRLDGLEATGQITRDPRLAETRVIVLTTFEFDDYVFGALRSGASGFLLKDVEPESLIAAVRTVAAGDWRGRAREVGTRGAGAGGTDPA